MCPPQRVCGFQVPIHLSSSSCRCNNSLEVLGAIGLCEEMFDELFLPLCPKPLSKKPLDIESRGQVMSFFLWEQKFNIRKTAWES